MTTLLIKGFNQCHLDWLQNKQNAQQLSIYRKNRHSPSNHCNHRSALWQDRCEHHDPSSIVNMWRCLWAVSKENVCHHLGRSLKDPISFPSTLRTETDRKSRDRNQSHLALWGYGTGSICSRCVFWFIDILQIDWCSVNSKGSNICLKQIKRSTISLKEWAITHTMMPHPPKLGEKLKKDKLLTQITIGCSNRHCANLISE